MKRDLLLGAVSLSISVLMAALYILNRGFVFLLCSGFFGIAGSILLAAGVRFGRTPPLFRFPESIARGIILDRLPTLVGAGVGGFLASRDGNVWYIVLGIGLGSLAGVVGGLAFSALPALRFLSLTTLSTVEHRTNIVLVVLSVLMAISAAIGFVLYGETERFGAAAFFILCVIVLVVAARSKA